MEIYLLKSFQFRQYEIAPYRVDGYGGDVFHGVGSHILYSDLRNRWYRFGFEAATINQPLDVHLVQSRLTCHIKADCVTPGQGEMQWRQEARRPTTDPTISSYLWMQHAEIDLAEPGLVDIKVEFQFSNSSAWIPVDGTCRVLVDLHPGKPPKYYSKPAWYIRRLFSRWPGKDGT